MKTRGDKVLALVFGTASAALASDGGVGGMSPLVLGFLAFFAVIVAFQAIPSLVMLVSVLRGLLAGMTRSRLPAVGGDEREQQR